MMKYHSNVKRNVETLWVSYIHNCSLISKMRASLVAQLMKNLPAMRETWVQSLGREDPLEKEKATHPSILAWRIPWTIQSMGSQRMGHD